MKKIKIPKKIFAGSIILAVSLCMFIVALAVRFSEKKVEHYSFCDEQNFLAFEEAQSFFEDSNGNKLSVDTNNGTVRFEVPSSKTVLDPLNGNAFDDGLANTVSLVLRDEDGNSYTMNSSDNSASFGAFECKPEKNKLVLTYSFYENYEKYENAAKEDLYATVPVEFSVCKYGFKVSVNMTGVTLKEGFYVESISLVPGLFSTGGNMKGQKYAVPDGCGCLVDLSAQDTEKTAVSLPVYNSDIFADDYQTGALVPCFAYTDGKVCVTEIIDDGDALSTIHYLKYKNQRASIYNEFKITPVSEKNGDFCKGKSYDGNISIILNFEESTENFYGTVAFRVHDFLAAKGYIRDAVSEDIADLPALITVIGSPDGKQKNTLCDFEGAEEMLTLLNSKGVRSIYMRYTGVLKGGLFNEGVINNGFKSALGTQELFTKLCKTAKEKNSKVFLETNLMTGVSPQKNISGNALSFSLYGDICEKAGVEGKKSFFTDVPAISQNISSFFNLSSNIEDGGVSLNDVSYLLYSSKDYDRQKALSELGKKTYSLCVNSPLMLSQPAIYLMKAADAVASIPQKNNLLTGSGTESIPFVQMVLHGSVVYGGDFINTSDGWNTVLKCVEYGAVPSYIFTYENSSELSYGRYASLVSTYSSKLKPLKAVADMRMTSHEKMQDGVYKIIYNFNKIVYVNYTKSVVEVEGVLISPQDFIIV